MSNRPDHIKPAAEIPWREVNKDGQPCFRTRRLGTAAGSEDLGCSIIEIAPGKHAFPYHLHYGVEEAVYILSGQGRVCVPQGEFAVQAGDYLAFRRGEGGAHKFFAAEDEPMVLLCFATRNPTDVTRLPDSGKNGIWIAAGDPAPNGFYKPGQRLQMFDGEED